MSRVPIPPEQQPLRQEVCRIGRSLFERGLVHSTAGNISLRLERGYLITPTDACLGFLEPEQLAWVDEDGQQLGGERASKTLALHRCIYAGTQARCVLHTHSTHLVALTLQGIWSEQAILPPITPYQVMKVGIADLLRVASAPPRAVMLDRLGPVAWGESAAQAMAILEELEETARLWLLCNPRPQPLTAAQLQELQQTFGTPW
jgi:ribulose-5-phosphate 4-epimerase/fuculose-1-phosphate aldolase